MAGILDTILDAKHRVETYINPVREELSALVDDIDPALNPSDSRTGSPKSPRIMSNFCPRASSCESACGICAKVCPTDALSFEGGRVPISSDCIHCDICTGVCPAQALVSQSRKTLDIFDVVGRNSALYNTSYITCERSGIGKGIANVYTVSCLGSLSRSEWSYLMNTYPNVALFIPENLCQGCAVSCGESLFRAQIHEAEKSALYPLGLVRNVSELDTRMKPHLEREDLAVQASKNTLSARHRIEALKEIEEQKRSFRDIEKQVLQKNGNVNAQKHLRRVTDAKKLDLLCMLHNHEFAQDMPMRVPCVSPELCTGCMKCSHACPVGACEIDRRGNFHVAPELCVGCGACASVCNEFALAMIYKHF